MADDRQNRGPEIDSVLDTAQFSHSHSHRMVDRKENTNMKIPKFKNESEEANWLYAHRKEIEAFKGKPLRGKNGKLMTPAEIATAYIAKQTRPVTLRLATVDIERAKVQAEKAGLGYQTYLKSLIHQALKA
jgi:predicted DNA binding CopG/RHH family protein